MALPAFREGDISACPEHGTTEYRSNAPIPIETNGRTQRRCGDVCLCGDAPDVIERGAATVLVRGEYAARILAPTRHGGFLVLGSGNVVIGGPDGLGLRRPPHARCKSMAAGRSSGTTTQTYNNCATESARYLIEQTTGERMSEDGALSEALLHGEATYGEKGRLIGGSTPDGIQSLLDRHGVETEAREQNVDGIASDVQSGRGVIASVYGDKLFHGPQAAAKGAHMVVVTGVELGPDGKPATFIVQDSGSGTCSRRVSADEFEHMLIPENPAVVTKKRIW